MKTPNLYRILACAVVVTAFGCGRLAMADTVVVSHDAWSHDDHGYWDDHGQRHAYIEHNHHHGFWREQNGARVFINID